MSYNFKKINELELVNDVPTGANVLIETDGATKRLPSTAINNGYTKEECDDKFLTKDTIAKPDLAQNDPTQPDYVKNRTHWEEVSVVNEPLNITWDCNTEGLVSDATQGVFWKVSDIVLTDDQFKSGTVTLADGPSIVLSEAWDELVADNQVCVTEDVIGAVAVFVARKDEAVLTIDSMSITFPEAGIYFMAVSSTDYCSAFTTTEPVEQVKTTIHKLDPKYLPDGVGGVKYATISSTYGAEPSYSADATYAQITEWLAAGMDVKCVFDNLVLNLSYSSQPINGLMHATDAPFYRFVTVIWGEEHNITIYEDGYVEYNYSSYATSGSIPDVANLGSDWIADLKTALGLDSPT